MTTFRDLTLRPELPIPIYQQLYEYLRGAILAGQLERGTKLPSTRAFAEELGISRNTILNAYDQLTAEGYLESVQAKGIFVTHTLPDTFLYARPAAPAEPRIQPASPANLPPHIQTLLSVPTMPIPQQDGRRIQPFWSGLPAVDKFPYELWAKLMNRHAQQLHPHLMMYQEPAGYRPLREAIANHVILARQVRCTPEQVIIVSGSQEALYLAGRVLLAPGDTAWIEDPGYPGARNAFLAAGAQLIPVPVDAEGLIVETGEAYAPDAKIAYVTPSHQFPMGVTLSLSRRLALLAWAKQHEAYILEDDYDSEYRFSGRPVASLQGLDQHQRVIYIGTFSKVLFPALRVGYLIVPPPLVTAFLKMRWAIDYHTAILEQTILADFIREGHFVRHIRRMRTLYAKRRTALMHAAEKASIEIHPSEAGIHLVCWLPDTMDDRLVSRQAAQHGLNVTPVSAFTLQHAVRPGLMLGYAAFDEPALERGIQRLAAALATLR